jgi:hypothetical protein
MPGGFLNEPLGIFYHVQNIKARLYGKNILLNYEGLTCRCFYESSKEENLYLILRTLFLGFGVLLIIIGYRQPFVSKKGDL